MTYIRQKTLSTTPQLNPRALRDVFGTFATGVTVVTTLGADRTPVGMTANSFTSVSLEPALILACIGKQAAGFPAFEQAEFFAVNMLGADQQQTSNLFATRGAEKFAGVDWRTHTTGAPILEGAIAWLDCKTFNRIDAGDHLILIGEVVDLATTDGSPLCFWRGKYQQLDSLEGGQS